MTDNLVEQIREHHKRQGFAPHVCTECGLPWPCEALVAAQRIEEMDDAGMIMASALAQSQARIAAALAAMCDVPTDAAYLCQCCYLAKRALIGGPE